MIKDAEAEAVPVGALPAARPDRLVRADRGDSRERLDLVLQRHLADIPEASRTKIQDWIREGHVLVNGKAGRPSDKVQTGDEISVVLPPPPPPKGEIIPEDIALSVLYEDDYLLVIDKPPGLVVHPAVGHRQGTLVHALLFRSQDWGGESDRPGLVHRLDKDTSGVLIVAKTQGAHALLTKAMRNRTMEKQYWAVVYGRPPVQKGKIDLKVLRDRLDRKRMTTSRLEGRDSTTVYERMGESTGAKAGVSLLECTLVTGRTHQIRVHLKSQNLPIVGDPTYGSPRWKGIKDEELAAACRDFPRQALHARRLAVDHPITGKHHEFIAPIPADMASLLGAAEISATKERAVGVSGGGYSK
ncbi:MAG: RluA family pseudouridine synthase [Thermoanaerobaculia bacterium]